MAKQQNDNIGNVVCLIKGCQEQAAVRRNRSGKYYFDCPDHGRITPNLPEGQAAIMEHAHIWGAGKPPADCARWIAEQWPWGMVVRDPASRRPVDEGSPVNEAATLTGPAAPPAPAPVTRGTPPPPPGPAQPQPVEQAPAPEPEPEAEEPSEDEWA